MSSIFNFSVIARTRNFRGGLVFIPPFLKELVYWIWTSLNTTLLAICISHVNVISMKGCYHNEKAVIDGRTDGRQERVLELELCSQLKSWERGVLRPPARAASQAIGHWPSWRSQREVGRRWGLYKERLGGSCTRGCKLEVQASMSHWAHILDLSASFSEKCVLESIVYCKLDLDS